MLLAIDVGNTHTVYGLWNGTNWAALWRRPTDPQDTEDQVVVWLRGLFSLQELEFKVHGIICASVVPAMNDMLDKLGTKWMDCKPKFLQSGPQVGMKVRYEPVNAVGPDRIANSIAALEFFQPPVIMVDFGTATTVDAVGRDRAYEGGAILPGVMIASDALFTRTAKLMPVEYVAPKSAIGRNTNDALQAGIMLGYAGAIDSLVRKIDIELGGGSTVIATGGLGGSFLGICETIERYEPTLTLDGLVIAAAKLS